MNTAADFRLRFSAFDALTGAQFSEHASSDQYGHATVEAARARLGHINHFRSGDVFVDVSSLDTIGVVRTVEIVAAF